MMMMATTTPMPSHRTKPAIPLSARDRVAVIAGSGRLPVNVASGLKAAGHAPFVVIVGSEAGDASELKAYDHATLELEEMAALIPLLKRSITHVVLAGNRPRPAVGGAAKPRLLPCCRVSCPAWQCDDALLRPSSGSSKGGPRSLAHQIVPDLIAGDGVMTRASRRPPTQGSRRRIRRCQGVGALDIGQAASPPAAAHRVEGVGTDGLLARTRELRAHGRLAGKKRGVIVKCAKPNQELRADMPAIGPLTVAAAHEAALAGLGVEAGRSLILDYETVCADADALGLFVIGLQEDGT